MPESPTQDRDAALYHRLARPMWAVLYAPANVFEHQWAPGDLALWDNFALQHGRPEWPVSAPRSLRRVCVCELEYRDMLAEADLSHLS